MSTDHPPDLTARQRMLLTWAVIALLTIAAWILAAHTIGDALSTRNADLIGFAVALLVVVTAIYLSVLWDPNRGAVLPLGLTLVACGTASILLSVGLQFYLVALTGEEGRRLADLVSERQKLNQQGNVNLTIERPPKSVHAIGYLALLGGLWLAAVGIRVGLGRPPVGPPPLPRPAGAADAPVGPA